jgi:S1-C subfamily serine protease
VKKCVLLFTVAAFCVLGHPAVAVEFDHSVVQLVVAYQAVDPMMPWVRNPPAYRYGLGVAVASNRIIAPEFLVRNCVMVELRLARSGVKFPARVIQADYQTGAALLAYDGLPAADALHPLELATVPPTTGEVTIVQFDETGQIQREQGRVIETTVADLPDAPGMTLVFRVLASLNTGDAGAPVLQNGKVVGVVLRSDPSSQTCSLLPYPVLRRFMKEAGSPKYGGVASAGFTWTPLVDPVKRAFYGAPPNGGGILVLHTLAGSGADKALQPQDVILAWDGTEVDSIGYYTDPDFGRLLIPYLISGRRYPGDTIPVTLLRNRKRLEVRVPLARRLDQDAFIPENIDQEQPEYLVDCGLIIRELGAEYLRHYGPKWTVQANPRLVHEYLTRGQEPDKPGDRLVILARVLPDAINISYQQIRDATITAVNGTPIRNLADVFRIVNRDGGLRRVALLSTGQDLVLDPEGRTAANQRLAERYRIPALQYRKRLAHE